eukprot:gene5133-8739_t
MENLHLSPSKVTSDITCPSPSGKPKGKERPIAVIGASSMDFYSYVDHFPKEGETILAEKFEKVSGGKASNQAYMVSNLVQESKVCFISCVGDDENGKVLKENMKKYKGIDQNIHVIPNTNTTISQIFIDKNYEKRTVTTTGCHQHFSSKEIDKSWSDIQTCRVLLCSMELNEDVILYALKKAKFIGMLTILNPTNPNKNISKELLNLCDVICPNQEEASIISGIEIKTVQDAKEAAKIIRKKGGKTIIITLGSKGSIIYEKESLQVIEVNGVENPVDVSGIGDCWIGSLTYFLGCSIPTVDSIHLASFLASISLQKFGIRSLT